MKRGEVWWVNFSPSIGGEIRKNRPAVIVSIDASNKVLNRVQIVPITSKTDRVYPCEARITLKKKPHKAMADQITTVSKKRLGRRLGSLTGRDMNEVARAIKIQLGLQ